MLHTNKAQRGWRIIQEDETSKVWEQASLWRRRTKNIGERWGWIMQSHDGHTHWRMGWSPIVWYHVLPDLVTRSLSDVTHHRKIPRSVIIQKTKFHNNACRRYHPGFWSGSHNWWKSVPYKKSVNMQIFHKWKIYVKHQICYLWTIYTCPLQCRNAGVTYTNNIGDLSGYSNPIWYKPKVIANILSLGFVHKHNLVTHNNQYGN